MRTQVSRLAAAAAVAWTLVASAAAEESPEVARQKAIRKAQGELLAAAKGGEVAQVRALLRQGTDVNARDAGQRTPLLLAVRAGRFAVARALLEAREDLDARDPEGRTP